MKKTFIFLIIATLLIISTSLATASELPIYDFSENLSVFFTFDNAQGSAPQGPLAGAASTIYGGIITGVPGIQQEAFDFPNNNSYILIQGGFNSVPDGTDIGMSTWIYPHSGNGYLINNYDSTAGRGIYLSLSGGDVICGNQVSPGNYKTINWGSSLNFDTQWYHIVCNIEGSTGNPELIIDKIPTNQTITTSGTVTYSERNSGQTWAIGALAWSISGAGKGGYADTKMDGIGIFSITLNESHIADLNKNGSSLNYTELTSTYTCNANWTCDGYAACDIEDEQKCNSVTDTNTCGDNYTGDYTEFTPSTCDYCTPNWTCSEYEECIEPLVNASCTNVTDNNTCSEPYTGDYTEFNQICVYTPVASGGGGGNWPEQEANITPVPLAVVQTKTQTIDLNLDNPTTQIIAITILILIAIGINKLTKKKPKRKKR